MSDLYDKEVDTLLKMGGQKALENQYKNISRRLEIVSDENKELRQNLNLQKDKRCEEEIERNYLAGRFSQLKDENMELKQRIAELEQSRSEWIDKAVEWQQKCEKLESGETSELPFDPLECANYVINATYERETSGLERGLKGLPEKVNSDRYTVDDLEQIAEHLLVYCKHNKETE